MLEVNDEGVTTYQKDLGIYCKKMLQRTRNILEVTARRCYNVSGTSWEVNILTLTGRSCDNVSEGCWKSLKKMFPRIGKNLGS